MHTLVILRHAEAAPSKSDDHARPLTPRGRADAMAAGRALQVTLSSAPLVLASDAKRTRETAELAFSAFPSGVDLKPVEALYSATPAILLKAVQDVPETTEIVVVVGHNPGISAFARHLIASGSDRDRARVQGGLPTAGAAIYTFDGPWSAVGAGTGRLTATHLPGDKA